MTSDACREMRAALGAAALAAATGIGGDDDVALRAHLDGCPECRAELRELTSVARALPLADPSRLECATPQPPPALATRILDRIARQRAARRDRVRRRVLLGSAVAAACAAAIVAAVLVISGSGSGPGGTRIAFPTKAGVAAHATLRDHTGGTEVSFHVEGLHDGDYYWLWLTDAEGERVGAGTFRGTPAPLDLTMTAAIRLPTARRIWVTDAHQAVVLDTPVPHA